MANHVAAIHVLKGKLQLTQEDYEALLINITRTDTTPGKSSCTAMTPAEHKKVRDHMQQLGERLGVLKPTRRRPMTREQFAKAKAAASPRERKVWALWHQLHRDGLVQNPSRAALDAWVERTVHVSALRFCTSAQLDTCIEALKAWVERGGHG